MVAVTGVSGSAGRETTRSYVVTGAARGVRRAIAEPAEQFLLNHAKATRPLPADHFALLYAAIASINSMLDQFSQRIEPQRLLDEGFAFAHNDIHDRIADALR